MKKILVVVMAMIFSASVIGYSAEAKKADKKADKKEDKKGDKKGAKK